MGLDFFKNILTLLSAKYIFNNTNLSNLPNGFFDGCINLTTIDGLLFNNNIVTIPTGFLSGNTGLTSFRFSTFTNKDFTIPADFLQGCLGTVSINNLFTDSPITTISDNFFHSLVSVNPTNLFTNSAIKTIGNNCFDSVQMSDASYMFSGTTHGKVESIGNNFMVNSKVQSLEATFKDSLTIKTIGNNFMGIGNDLTTLLDCFNGCSSLISIGPGFSNNAPNLLSVIRVFFNCSSLLELPIGMLNNSPLLNNAMYFISGTGITSIPDGFLPNNSGLSSLDNMILGWNITNIGNDFMSGKTGLLSIDNLFKDNVKLVSVGNNFLVNGSVQTANGLFQNCSSIKSIGDNFLSDNPLTSANHFFDGALALTTIGDNFFTDFTNLVDITYFFNNTTISELPTYFLINCLKVNSLEGVFTNSQITSLPDEFLMNNTGITSFKFLKDSVSTSIFANTLISEIGDSFMYGSTGLTNLDYAFEGNTTISTIGKLFLANSAVTTANYAFYNDTGLMSVGSGCLNGCVNLSSLISMFEGCLNLEKIGEYTEWYNVDNHSSYLYQKEVDNCKCNTAGQQAEVALFCSVPYGENEFDSFGCDSISDLAKLLNIFKGTGLIRTPKGFLKNISNQTAPTLSSVLSGTNIKFINTDLMEKSNITNVSNMFDNTKVIAIPNGFMQKYNYESKVHVNWYNKATQNQNIAYIPSSFLYNMTLSYDPLVSDNPNNSTFELSSIRIIQNDWLNWEHSAQICTWYYNVKKYSLEEGFNFKNSNLVNIPRNLFGVKFTRSFNIGDGMFLTTNLDTIIPEGFLENATYFNTHLYSNSFNAPLKGVVPKRFLCKTAYCYFRNLFAGSNIIALENGFLSHSFEIKGEQNSSYWSTQNLFYNATFLKEIPDSFLSNAFLTTPELGLPASSMFYNSHIQKPPKFLTRFKWTYIDYCFSNTTNIINTDGSWDEVLNWMTNSSTVINARDFLISSSIQRVPDDIFKDCPNVTNMSNAFAYSKILKLPKNLLSTGTNNPCDLGTLFGALPSLNDTIPVDFLKNVKTESAYMLFRNSNGLYGTVPSNLLLASNGMLKNMNYMFSGTSITGFDNNTWNITDFTKVVEMQECFSRSKITKLPSCFFTTENKFTLLENITNFAINVNITSLEDNFLANAPALKYANNAFRECFNLVSVGNNFLNNSPALLEIGSTFFRNYALVSIGTGFVSNSPALYSIGEIFAESSSLTGVIQNDFFGSSNKITNMSYSFKQTKITNFVSGCFLEKLTTGSSCNFQYTFNTCTNYTGVFPQLWSLYSNGNHNGCFNGAINASNYSSIPSDWK